MNCKIVKDYLMTDYLDNEMNAALKEQVEQHLVSCAACRDFEATLVETAREPFKDVGEIKPPQDVWQNIQSTIIQEQLNQEPAPDSAIRFPRLIPQRRPVFVMATALALVLLTMTFIRINDRQQKIAQNGAVQEESYLAYLSGVDQDSDILLLDTENETSIEKYLL
ncbi:MAG: zf-HC2 domain-containing protein [Candidatus Omnitrophota bacterium]